MTAKIRYVINIILPYCVRMKLRIYCSGILDRIVRAVLGVDDVWEQDSNFIQLYNRLSQRTALTKSSAYVLYKLAMNCADLDGLYAELGVYRGGSAEIMFEATKKKKDLYLFDTFEGLPVSENRHDAFWKKGGFNNTTIDEVKGFLSQNNFHFFKGVFPETLEKIPENSIFAFAHIDPDLYQGVMDACRFFYPRMTVGGIMLFDDYGLLSCRGVRMAVDEFFADKVEQPVYMVTGQSFIVKR